MTLVARKTLPPQNFQEFLSYAKANKVLAQEIGGMSSRARRRDRI
jgi:tripartite-type tricarboxylate transporter receptor subunit TctC